MRCSDSGQFSEGFDTNHAIIWSKWEFLGFRDETQKNRNFRNRVVMSVKTLRKILKKKEQRKKSK